MIDCHCGVWCCGLITLLRYVSLTFGNLVLKRLVSKFNIGDFFIISAFVHISMHVSYEFQLKIVNEGYLSLILS